RRPTGLVRGARVPVPREAKPGRAPRGGSMARKGSRRRLRGGKDLHRLTADALGTDILDGAARSVPICARGGGVWEWLKGRFGAPAGPEGRRAQAQGATSKSGCPGGGIRAGASGSGGERNRRSGQL